MTVGRPAFIQSVFDFAIREINALEIRIVQAEDDADGMLWEQARQVVEQLDAGLSQRQLAAQWINARTGEAYSRRHVQIVQQLVSGYLNSHPRSRFRDAYNAITNAKPHVAQATGDYEWYSPPEIVAAARDVLGDIDLDPASSAIANTVVRAGQFYSLDDDGLTRDWHGRVWMNPPYASTLIDRFCEKFARHVTAGDISAGIVFTNNATETAWFATLAEVAAVFCFPGSRCRCWKPDHEPTTPLQGQTIVYSGPDRAAFCERFAEFGLVLVRP